MKRGEERKSSTSQEMPEIPGTDGLSQPSEGTNSANHDFELLASRTINLCCLSYSVCGPLLQQLQKTNTDLISKLSPILRF